MEGWKWVDELRSLGWFLEKVRCLATEHPIASFHGISAPWLVHSVCRMIEIQTVASVGPSRCDHPENRNSQVEVQLETSNRHKAPTCNSAGCEFAQTHLTGPRWQTGCSRNYDVKLDKNHQVPKQHQDTTKQTQLITENNHLAPTTMKSLYIPMRLVNSLGLLLWAIWILPFFPGTAKLSGLLMIN